MCQIGVSSTLKDLPGKITLEATRAGFYITAIIRELLEEGMKPMLPLLTLSPHQQAERIADKKTAEQQMFG